MWKDAACRHGPASSSSPLAGLSADNKVRGLYAIERLTLLDGSNYSPTADSSGTHSGWRGVQLIWLQRGCGSAGERQTVREREGEVWVWAADCFFTSKAKLVSDEASNTETTPGNVSVATTQGGLNRSMLWLSGDLFQDQDSFWTGWEGLVMNRETVETFYILFCWFSLLIPVAVACKRTVDTVGSQRVRLPVVMLKGF